MVGDKIIMPSNAMMMIHNPYTITMGNANELRKLAEDLDKVRDSIVPVYAEKTGLDDKTIKELMDAETWFTADEAAELGFADEVQKEKKLAASLNGKWLTFNGLEVDIAHYKNLKADKIVPTEAKEPEKEEIRFNPVDLYEKALKNITRRLKT
jgi:ATP-dependent Clp protease protease subunit